MIYIFGDSHANFSFKNLNIPHINNYENSITMFRIGRDNIIINLDKSVIDNNSIIIINYGEVDYRFHIINQINLGKNEDIIINELITNYFNTIHNNFTIYNKIIIVAVIPPINNFKFEQIHGPITHEFPFKGTDEQRVLITNKVNNKIKEYCNKYNYIYFDPFDYYKDIDGTLKFELSDTICHLKDNTHFLNEFYKLF